MLRSALFTLTVAPLLVLLATFLLPLAFFTTTFAFLALAARVSVVYLELFAALLLHHLRHLSHSAKSPSCPIEAALLRRSPSVRSYESDERSTSPTLPHNVYAASTGPTLSRDFEGIGGWRDEGDAGADPESERQWLAVNARLELLAPAEELTPRRHHRSRTAGSVSVERFGTTIHGVNNPERADGEESPTMMAPGDSRAKSMIMLGEAGMNIGRTRSKRRRGSKSSWSSSNSGNSGALAIAHRKVE